MAKKKQSDKKDNGSHYRFNYRKKLTPQDKRNGYVDIKLDPARIALVYEVKNMMQATITKKALCAGDRGHKDILRDIDDIICAAERWKEMVIEDEDNG